MICPIMHISGSLRTIKSCWFRRADRRSSVFPQGSMIWQGKSLLICGLIEILQAFTRTHFPVFHCSAQVDEMHLCSAPARVPWCLACAVDANQPVTFSKLGHLSMRQLCPFSLFSLSVASRPARSAGYKGDDDYGYGHILPPSRWNPKPIGRNLPWPCATSRISDRTIPGRKAGFAEHVRSSFSFTQQRVVFNTGPGFVVSS